MALLEPEELAAFAGVESAHPRLQPAVAAAEALVAAWIGCETLGRRSLSCSLTPPRFRRTLELPQGPLSDLLAVSEAGAALDPADFVRRPWSLARPGGFAAGRRLEVVGTLGWSRDEGPPPPESLRQALLLTAAEQLERTASWVVSERLGDHAVTYAEATGVVPATAGSLLRAWRRP